MKHNEVTNQSNSTDFANFTSVYQTLNLPNFNFLNEFVISYFANHKNKITRFILIYQSCEQTRGRGVRVKLETFFGALGVETDSCFDSDSAKIIMITIVMSTA